MGLPVSAKVFIALTVAVLLLPIVVSCQSAGGRGTQPVLGDEPVIRVRIRSGIDRLTLTPAAAGRLIAEPRRGGLADGPSITFDAGGTVVLDTGGVTLSAGEQRARAAPGSVLRVAPLRGTRVRVDDADMPGTVEIYESGGALDVVVEVPMETYLKGVLAGELYASWPVGAYQAQAVAARSYALHEMKRARSKRRSYDIESTTLDQMFVGATESRQAEAAVFSTRGVVLYDRGQLLRAYYSSTCGDRAASAGGVWPVTGEFVFNTSPSLQAHERDCPCEKSPMHRWTRTRTADELRARLRAWGVNAGSPIGGIDRLTAIEPTNVNKAGRPDRFRLTDRRGTAYTLSAEELRVALNFAARGQPEITRETRVPSGDLVATFSGDTVTFDGMGFGHGVGLCQWGAFGQASAGTPWRQIVLHYYKGATLVRLW